MNLEQVLDFACADLRGLATERSEEIYEAARVVSQEADEDAKAKLKLGLSITVNLDDNTMDTTLSFSVKRSATAEHTLDDPGQPALPGVESVTISTAGTEPVTLTRESMHRAIRKIDKELKDRNQ